MMEGQGWPLGNLNLPANAADASMPDIPRMMMIDRNGMLGIEGESLGQEAQLAEFFGVKDGVLVKAVIRNSAAEKAGIKAGDVIVKVGDTKVNNTREITGALRALRPQKTFTVTVVRNKKEMPVTVTLEDTSGAVRAMLEASRSDAGGALGPAITYNENSNSKRSRVRTHVFSFIHPNSIASRAGKRRGNARRRAGRHGRRHDARAP